MPVLAVLLILLSANALAFVNVADQATAAMPLSGSIRYLEDRGKQLSLEDILTIQPNEWKLNTNRVFSKGYSESAWWLAVRLDNQSAAPLTRLLEIGYPLLDHIRIYNVLGTQSTVFDLGDNLPFDARPIKANHFVVPLQIPANTHLDLYIRIRTQSALQVPITLWKKPSFYEWNRVANLAQGFYFGVMIVMALYNLLVFLAVRDRNFMLYVCFAFSLPLFIAGLKGYSFEYFWPNNPELNNHAIVFPLCLALLFGAMFTESFLKVHKLGRWASKLFRSQQICIIALLLLSLFVNYSTIIQILIPVAAISCCLGLVFAILMWNHSGLSGRYYTLGWGAFLSGGLCLGLNKLGIIPTNLLTENTLQVGSGIEVILLSFALATSINEDRAIRSEAQSKALQAERETRHAREQSLLLQKQATEELEQKVQVRTSELEALNQQLSELSDTDQLTRVKNRRYMDRFLLEELSRCSRYQHNLSVILLDIDHFKQFNDRYGHLVGDDCLRAVAEVLKAGARNDVDCLARYGGEEFCILMPEASLECATSAAETLRRAVYEMLFKVRDNVVNVSISLGVATTDGRTGISAEQLLSRADAALYQAKKGGRNRVVAAETGHDSNMSPKSSRADAR